MKGLKAGAIGLTLAFLCACGSSTVPPAATAHRGPTPYAKKSTGKFGARVTLSTTTLTYALPAGPFWPQTVYLGSVNGITPPGNPINDSGIGDPDEGSPSFTLLQIDLENMQVLSINALAKSVFVNRGYLGTISASHSAAATVYFGPPQDFPWYNQ